MSMLSLSLSGTVFSLSSPALTPTRQPHRPLSLDEHLDQPTLSTEAKLGGINFELFVLRQVAAHRQYSHATICAARVRSVQAIAQLPPAKRQMPSRSNRQNSPNLRSFHPIRSAARIAVAGPALDSVARCARLQAPAAPRCALCRSGWCGLASLGRARPSADTRRRALCTRPT